MTTSTVSFIDRSLSFNIIKVFYRENKKGSVRMKVNVDLIVNAEFSVVECAVVSGGLVTSAKRRISNINPTY